MSPKLLITGPAGSGKTHAVLERVLANLREGKGGSTLCLLPTYGQVEHIKRRFVSFGGNEALFDPPFLTFTGLYERLIPGKRVRGLASWLVRRHLMEKAIGEADVPAFRKVAKLPGFRDRALEVVKEIRENGLETAEIRGEVEAEFRESDEGSERIRGFLEIALAYEERLRLAGVTDHEGALLEILEAVQSGQGPEPSLVAADGFANFTRLEFRILQSLTRRAGTSLVTLPRDGPRADSLFRVSSETCRSLLEEGFRERPLEEVRRTASPPLRRIAHRLFARDDSVAEAEGRVLQIIGADRASEVDLIAREIGRIRRGEIATGASRPPELREIGVILRRLDGYRDLVPPIFSRHGIPVRLVLDPLPLRSEPILRHALAYLHGVTESFDADGFLRYLRSGHVSAGEKPLSRREREGIRQRADEISEQVRKEGAPKELEKLLELAPGRSAPFMRVAGFLRKTTSALKARGDPREVAAKVEAALFQGVSTSFQGRRGEVTGDAVYWQDRFRKESAALAVLGDSIREAGSPLLWDGSEVTAERIVAAVTEWAMEASTPVRDRRLNCVNVIDAREARHWDSLRVVFIAGLLEKEFPVYPREDIFIRDDERRRLNGRTRLSLRENLQQMDEERYLFYVAATRPRDLLYLTRPSHDAEGKAQHPSFYEGDLCRLFGEDEVVERRAPIARPSPPPEEATLPQDLEREFAASIGSGLEVPGAALALYQTAPDRGIFRPGMEFLQTGGADLREPDLREAIGMRMGRVSASSINSFIRCPRLHFITKILGVREPDRGLHDRLDPMEVGRISHGILERHHGEKGSRPIEEAISEVLEEELRPLQLGIREEIVLARLRRVLPWTLEREARDRGPFRPEHLERFFGEDDGIELSCQGGPVTLRGKIDRIDTAPIAGKKHCLVVDYKQTHGFRKGDLEDLQEMGNVQLLYYAGVVRRLLDLPVAGVELFPLESETRGGVYLDSLGDAVEGRVESKATSFLPAGELDDLIRRCEETIVAVVERARAGEVVREPEDPRDCTPAGCDAFLICRPDRPALLREAAEEEEEE